MNNYQSYIQNAEREILKSKVAVQSLKLFAQSEPDLKMKLKAYSAAMGNTAFLEDLALSRGAKRNVMNFSATAGAPGLGAGNLRGTTIYPATILSYVTSIASIFAVEREMDTPQADLQVMDFYNLLTGDSVLPNLGKDAPFGASALDKDLSGSVNGTNKEFSLESAVAIVPKSVEVIVVTPMNTIISMVDNGNGKLLAEPGFLTEASINYKTGSISFKTATAPATNTKIKIHAILDTPAEDSVEVMGGENKYFHVVTEPIVIPIQRNIVTDAAMSKQGVIDPNMIYTNVIQSQYTKRINEMVVAAIVAGYEGDTYTADLSDFDLAAGRYDTLIRTFQSIITNAETILGQQTYKGSKCTGILAGAQVSNLFSYMTPAEGFTPNLKLGYFKDLIGWYKGIPVVRWDATSNVLASVADDEMYLTHKTEDGQLAPVVRGTFITPTDIPEIYNFKNPTQLRNGVFSLEGVRSTSSKMVVKVKVVLPESQYLQKA